MKQPGFVKVLQADLENVKSSIRSVVNRRGGLSDSQLLGLLLDPVEHSVLLPTPAKDTSVSFYHDDVEEYAHIGEESIKRGEVAFCILAGGLGTRMGGPKALLEIPELNMTLLTLKLYQTLGEGPVWIMTSPSLKSKIDAHLEDHECMSSRVKVLEQFESYRLTPHNQLFFEGESPSLYPCGHGDLFPVLTASKEWNEFKSRGGKYVVVVSVDNVLAALDPAVLGHHIKMGSRVTCEVVRRNDGENGGVLVDSPDGMQIVELFRLNDPDKSQYTWISTNSYIFNTNLEVEKLGVTWHRKQKEIEGKIVVQYERLMQEITAAYNTTFLGVRRNERYLPVVTPEDLNVVRKIVDINWHT